MSSINQDNNLNGGGVVGGNNGGKWTPPKGRKSKTEAKHIKQMPGWYLRSCLLDGGVDMVLITTGSFVEDAYFHNLVLALESGTDGSDLHSIGLIGAFHMRISLTNGDRLMNMKKGKASEYQRRAFVRVLDEGDDTSQRRLAALNIIKTFLEDPVNNRFGTRVFIQEPGWDMTTRPLKKLDSFFQYKEILKIIGAMYNHVDGNWAAGNMRTAFYYFTRGYIPVEANTDLGIPLRYCMAGNMQMLETAHEAAPEAAHEAAPAAAHEAAPEDGLVVPMAQQPEPIVVAAPDNVANPLPVVAHPVPAVGVIHGPVAVQNNANNAALVAQVGLENPTGVEGASGTIRVQRNRRAHILPGGLAAGDALVANGLPVAPSRLQRPAVDNDGLPNGAAPNGSALIAVVSDVSHLAVPDASGVVPARMNGPDVSNVPPMVASVSQRDAATALLPVQVPTAATTVTAALRAAAAAVAAATPRSSTGSRGKRKSVA